MKSLLTLSYLLAIAVVRAVNTDDSDSPSPPEPQNFYHLDIASEEKHNLGVWESKELDDVQYSNVKVKKGIPITRVTEGDNVIWHSPDRYLKSGSVVLSNQIPLMFSLVELNHQGKKFYKKTDEKWHQITEEAYNDTIKEIRHATPLLSEYALNLSYLFDNPKYIIERHTRKFVTLAIYTSKMGHRVKHVHEDGDLIWQASTPAQRCISAIAYLHGCFPLLVHLFIASEGIVVENIYYKKEKGEWKPIEENEYIVEVVSLRYDDTDFIPTELNLDVINPDIFDVKPQTYDRPYFTYVAKGSNRITTLRTNDTVIWESGNPEIFFAYAVSAIENEGNPMVKLHLNHRSPHFSLVYINIGETWEPSHEIIFNDAITNEQFERYTVVDIEAIHEKEASVIALKMEEIDYMLLAPKTGKDIMVLKHGEDILWEYQALENHFTNGWIYYFPIYACLFHFRVLDILTGHEDFYFMKIEDKWERVSRDAYKGRLAEILAMAKTSLDTAEMPSLPEDEPKDEEPPKESTGEGAEGHGPPLDPEIKEKPYSEYADPSFDPTADKETLELLTGHDIDPSHAPKEDKDKTAEKPKDDSKADKSKPIDPKAKETDHKPRRRLSLSDHKSLHDATKHSDDEFEGAKSVAMKRYRSTPDLRGVERRFDFDAEGEEPSDKHDKEPDDGEPDKTPAEPKPDAFTMPTTFVAFFLSLIAIMI